MADANDEPALARAIRDRLAVTAQRVSQRVGELRRSAPMNRAEALGVLGHESGIQISDYLTDETVARVRNLLGVSPAGRPTVGRAAKPSAEEEKLRRELAQVRRKLRDAESTPPFELADDELRERCLDLLNARGNYDRAINQALLVLEDRVRRTAKRANKEIGRQLMNRSFGDAGPLILSTEQAEQESGRMLFSGVIGFLRNPTGHRLGHNVAREDAAAVVGFVDYLLRVVGQAKEGALAP